MRQVDQHQCGENRLQSIPSLEPVRMPCPHALDSGIVEWRSWWSGALSNTEYRTVQQSSSRWPRHLHSAQSSRAGINRLVLLPRVDPVRRRWSTTPALDLSRDAHPSFSALGHLTCYDGAACSHSLLWHSATYNPVPVDVDGAVARCLMNRGRRSTSGVEY
jgi:hypothetical protein